MTDSSDAYEAYLYPGEPRKGRQIAFAFKTHENDYVAVVAMRATDEPRATYQVYSGDITMMEVHEARLNYFLDGGLYDFELQNDFQRGHVVVQPESSHFLDFLDKRSTFENTDGVAELFPLNRAEIEKLATALDVRPCAPCLS